MLIIQIALGIVLAVVLLAYLPTLLEFGGNVLLIGISLLLVWIAVVFLLENPVLLFIVLLAIIAATSYWWYLKNFVDEIQIKNLEKLIDERRGLGYATQTEEEQLKDLKHKLDEKNRQKIKLTGAISRASNLKKYRTEKERRKSLGYEE